MRILRAAGILSMVLLSSWMLASTVASAALPEFLDNITGNTFTATSGKAELTAPEGKVKIACEKDTVTLPNGIVAGVKLLEIVIDFEQCSDLGFPVVSLGDGNDAAGKKLGLILMRIKGELCYITAATKHVGMFFTVPEEHIEVPALGELLEVEGSVIGLVSPDNKLMAGPFTITFANPNLAECGGKRASLDYETNHAGIEFPGEMITAETVTFDKDIELMA